MQRLQPPPVPQQRLSYGIGMNDTQENNYQSTGQQHMAGGVDPNMVEINLNDDDYEAAASELEKYRR